jgi:DNA-binding NarL/FixJ family response regulator
MQIAPRPEQRHSQWPILPDRAQHIVLHLAQGFGMQGTAARLRLARITVQREVKRASRRLGIREAKRAVLVDAALRHGLINLPPHPHVELSPALVDVLELIAAGCSNEEIGDDLGLTVDAVKYRIQLILQALEASDRVQAVAMGWQRGILGRPRQPVAADTTTNREMTPALPRAPVHST